MRYVEGSFRWLILADDVVAHSIQFGLDGRVPRPARRGLGVQVEQERLARHCFDRPIVIES